MRRALVALVLVGTWKIDLRATPEAEAYFQELVVSAVDGNSVEDSFCGSEATDRKINADWGAVHFAYVTSGRSGMYNSAGVFDGRTIGGTTYPRGREFLSVWGGERAHDDDRS